MRATCPTYLILLKSHTCSPLIITNPFYSMLYNVCLTYPLHGAEYCLKNWLSLSLTKNVLLALWNPTVHHRVHKHPPLDPILSQVNSVRLINPYLRKVQLNVILPPTPKSSQWSLTVKKHNPINLRTVTNGLELGRIHRNRTTGSRQVPVMASCSHSNKSSGSKKWGWPD
jgi:hypothetical protein